MDNNENSSAEYNAENGNAVPPISEQQKQKEEMIPKIRFDEILSQKKTAEETARVYKDALEQSKKEAADAVQIAKDVESRVGEIQKSAWKEKALRSINQEAARLADEVGANFSGNTEEDYVQWAKSLEGKILPRLAKENKSGIDGNRSGDNATEITPDILKKMTPEQRIAYAEKVFPRVNI